MASRPRKPKPIEERFGSAVQMIRTLPKKGAFQTSNTQKLRFYSLYKQASEGPCKLPKPSFWDTVGRAKWEGWSVCGNMRKETAMQLYVEELQQLVETMPQSKEVEGFLTSVIGPYYDTEEEEKEEEEEEEEDEEEEEEKAEVAEEKERMHVAPSPLDLSPINGLPEAQSTALSESPLCHSAAGASASEGESSGWPGASESSGSESDEDYQESFQDLPAAKPHRHSNSTSIEMDVDSQVLVETQRSPALEPGKLFSTPPLLSPSTPRGHAASEGADHSHLQHSQRHSPVQASMRPRPLRSMAPGHGPTLLKSAGHSVSSDSLGLIPEEGDGGERVLGSNSEELRREWSLPLALEAVSVQLVGLQRNLQAVLQQLNGAAAAVRAIERTSRQGSSPGTQLAVEGQLPSTDFAHQRLRCWLVPLRKLNLHFLVVLWPALVSIVVYYLVRRYSRKELSVPPWIWVVFAGLQLFTSLVLKGLI